MNGRRPDATIARPAPAPAPPLASPGTSAPTRPLLAGRDLAAPLAWDGGRAVSGHAFLAAAARLAGRLPSDGRAINLCENRLHFALGLAAALLRGHPSLMPPNALPATLAQLPAAGAPLYVLADRADVEVGALPVVVVADGFSAAAGEGDEGDGGAAAAGAVPQVAADLDAVVLLTSGSTGAPQPHGKRFGALALNIGAEAARLAQWLGRPSLQGLAIVATVPPQHSYGLESSVLLALLGGAALDAGRPFYPADIAAALAAVPRPRMLVTTPFHLKALVHSGVALPPVDLVLSATAPLSPQLAAQAEAATGGRVGEIYGCTEAGQVAARLTTQGDTWTTLGELRIDREVTGTGAGTGAAAPGGAGGDAAEAGERFVVSGGHVALPTPLADVLVLHDARRFRLLGRANDLIHVAGKRSSLAHLNFHLNRIEGVEDGAFWLPEAGDLPAAAAGTGTGATGTDVESVQRPIAFVVAPRLAPAQVIAALRRALEPAFVPRRVVHVPSLPREATGKLTAAALRAFALATLPTLPTAAPTAAAVPAGGDDADTFTIAPTHPAFAGHFPGHPLLPGVVLLSLVWRALRRRGALAGSAAISIEQVKFIAPVGPGERVRVRFDRLAPAASSASSASSASPAALAVPPAASRLAFECLACAGEGAAERLVARGVVGPGSTR